MSGGIWRTLNWAVVGLLIFMSIAMLFSSVPAAMVLFISAIVISPQISGKIELMSKQPTGFLLKTAIVILGMAIAGGLAGDNQSKNNLAKADQFMEQAIVSLNSGDVEGAMNQINQAKSFYTDEQDGKALELESKITQSQSSDYAFEQLIAMTDTEYAALTGGNFDKQYFDVEYLNDQFLSLLKQEGPKRAQYLAEKAKQEEQRLAEEKRLAAERQKQEEEQRLVAEKQARTNMIESQFSAWDGAHNNLTKYIKANMNDPSSYKHVKTVYWDMKDHLVVLTTFRGTNAFGGVVTNSVKAKVSLDGQVLEIME